VFVNVSSEGKGCNFIHYFKGERKEPDKDIKGVRGKKMCEGRRLFLITFYRSSLLALRYTSKDKFEHTKSGSNIDPSSAVIRSIIYRIVIKS
jgi:hypothetical protein